MSVDAALRASGPADTDGRAALRDLLASLAAETGELAQCADRLQALFGQLMSQRPVASPDAMEQAQALDGLVQRLDGMQLFLTGLSSCTLADLASDTADIAGGLRLTSQARRFNRAGAQSADPTAAEECDLF